MGFWIFMLVCNLLIPVIMLVFGARFRKKAPAEINMLFGYRTARSMKNRETWDFAHHCAGRFWVRAGWVTLPLAVIAMLPLLGKPANVVGLFGALLCLAELVPLLAVVPVTERALRREFDALGQRRKRM